MPRICNYSLALHELHITQDPENAEVRPGKCAARQTLPAVPLKANLNKYLPGGNVWAHLFWKRKKSHQFKSSAFTSVIKISNHKQSAIGGCLQGAVS